MTEEGLGPGADLVDVARFFSEPGAQQELTHSLLANSTLETHASNERTDPGGPAPARGASPLPARSEGAPALLGRIFHGYKAELHLGSGASAHVYLGQHQQLDRRCAIKVLKPELRDHHVVGERMRREGLLLAEIRDPNVVSGIDVGLSDDGLQFILLELVEGRTLLELIQQEAPLPASYARALTRQVALGLSALHRRGIVHRDLKASNVMLLGPREQPLVKIMDLGLMRDTRTDATRLTVNARLLGTPSFMAPEQIIDPRAVTGAADLYALGVILYAMLSRRLPYDGAVPDGRAPATPEHWGELGPVVAGLLELDPRRRPRSAADVALALEGEAAVEPEREPTPAPTKAVSPPPSSASRVPSAPAPAQAQTHGHAWVTPTVATLGLMSALVAAGLYWGSRTQPAPPSPGAQAPIAIEREKVVAPTPEAASAAAPESAAPQAPKYTPPARSKKAAPVATTPLPSPAPQAEVPPPAAPTASAEGAADQRALVTARLDRSFERLRALAPQLQKARAQAFEQQYLELRRASLQAKAPPDWDDLARGVLELERELSRASEGATP